jgi:hypothetical protein
MNYDPGRRAVSFLINFAFVYIHKSMRMVFDYMYIYSNMHLRWKRTAQNGDVHN